MAAFTSATFYNGYRGLPHPSPAAADGQGNTRHNPALATQRSIRAASSLHTFVKTGKPALFEHTARSDAVREAARGSLPPPHFLEWREPAPDTAATAAAARAAAAAATPARSFGPLYAGLEGGATSSALVLYDGATGERLGGAVHGGALNYFLAGGAEACAAAIVAMARAAVAQVGASLPLAGLGALLSGCDRAPEQAAVRDACAALCAADGGPPLTEAPEGVTVRSDVDGSLYAATDGAGVLLIAGTGSNCLFRRNDGPGGGPGASHRCGGWGHLVGDEGSAYDVARRAIATVLRVRDGRGDVYPLANANPFFPGSPRKPTPRPQGHTARRAAAPLRGSPASRGLGVRLGGARSGAFTRDDVAPLHAAIKGYFGVEDLDGLLPHLYESFSKDRVAGLTGAAVAPLAADGDPVALDLFRRAGEQLGEMVAGATKGHPTRPHAFEDTGAGDGGDGPLDVVCVGSMFKSWGLLRDGFAAALARNGLPANQGCYRVRHLVGDNCAVGGAVMAMLRASARVTIDRSGLTRELVAL